MDLNNLIIEYSVYQYLSKSFMCDTTFRFDNIWGVLKYVINS